MNIVLNGGCGKMGKTIINLCEKKYPDFKIYITDKTKTNKVYKFDELKEKNIDVIIDFSTSTALENLLDFALKIKKPVVIGTTGYNENDFNKIKKASYDIALFYSPNMSIGVNICFAVSRYISSKIKSDVHIHEIHHKTKKDAPSGTALRFKDIISKNNTVSVSSSRLGNIVGEHYITFALEYEKIELNHIAYSREIFAQGAIFAAKWILDKKTGLYNFDDIFKF